MAPRRQRSFSNPATLGLLLAALATLAGCAGSAEPPAPDPTTPPTAAAPASPLAGTSWRLIEFTSMDDATGVKKPDDPSLYTMSLDTDGRVRMRLNCNRATGTWTAEPAADGDSGTFRFGPLATTKALCPPPSMDGLVSAQAQYVRGYLLRDGNLYLSLMADGGIFAWAPTEYQPVSDPR